jgi:RadC-like JAB domain-containing protein
VRLRTLRSELLRIENEKSRSTHGSVPDSERLGLVRYFTRSSLIFLSWHLNINCSKATSFSVHLRPKKAQLLCAAASSPDQAGSRFHPHCAVAESDNHSIHITQPSLWKSAPSEADIRLTSRLAEGVRILQINMLDQVIVDQSFEGQPGYFSFKEGGLI